MLSKRAELLKPATTARLSQMARELEESGEEVIALDVGEPDFPTPDFICEGAKRAIDEGFTKYTETKGILPLRKKICEKLWKENGLFYEPEEIIVTVGAKQAVYNALLSICDTGDEVLVLIPSWFSYDDMVRLLGGTPVLVPTKLPGFTLDLAAIERAITPRTKAIILNSPNNPSGAIYDEDSQRALAEMACRHDLYIISDEIYEKLIYGGQKHFSIASISEEVQNRTFTINGFSKAYCMTGWRVGYVAARREYVDLMSKCQNRMTSGNSSISQRAALAALEGDQQVITEMRRAFEMRRDYMYRRLNAMDGVRCGKAEGAFYLMPDMREFMGKRVRDTPILTTTALAEYILQEAKVVVTDGESFNYPGFVRISYSNSMEQIEKAMDRMEIALRKLL